MVIYSRRNFTKALYLVVLKSKNTYSFKIYRRDGKYLIYQSAYYTDIFECIDAAVQKVHYISSELKKDDGLIKIPKDYVPN